MKMLREASALSRSCSTDDSPVSKRLSNPKCYRTATVREYPWPCGPRQMMKVGSLMSDSLTVAVRKMRCYRTATVRERTMFRIRRRRGITDAKGVVPQSEECPKSFGSPDPKRMHESPRSRYRTSPSNTRASTAEFPTPRSSPGSLLPLERRFAIPRRRLKHREARPKQSVRGLP